MPFLSPTIIAVVIACLLQAATLGWGFYQSGRADRAESKATTCAAKHEAFVAQVDAQGKLAKEKAKATEETRRRTADETARGWAAALDVVRTDAARRVRAAASGSSGSRGLPADPAPGQPNVGADADPIPAAERLAADCAETTLTANYLQRYIEDLK